jgi:adenylate cyclase
VSGPPRVPATADSLAAFEAHLACEILHSERLRMAILAGIFALLTVLLPVFATVFREDYLRNFGSPAMIGYAAGVAAALVGYELLVRAILGRMLAAGRMPSPLLRFWNAFIETSTPTLVMLAMGQYANPVAVLQGPAAFLYAVFIVLSTLRLDFRLSVFTGVVAAAEFVALSFHVAALEAGGAAPEVLSAPGFILMKGVTLLLAGVAAGFVAGQLRRRIVKAYYAGEERQRIFSAFGQQVSPEVVEELLRQGPAIASRRSFVCVLFMDIRDFTRLVEKRSPEAIVGIQNAVFGAGIEVVNRHRGVINQFLGDGFMATFGAPISSGDDCRHAVAAARELVAQIAALVAGGRIPPLTIGLGLHAGEAVTGNVGTEARRQYSITGDVVILASRIEQLNKDYGSQILVSAEVLERCGEEGAGAVALGAVHVKGREEPIEIYRLA